MGKVRLFNEDDLAGAKTFWHENADGTITVEEHQDIEPLLGINQQVRDMTPGNWRGDTHRVASLPLNIYYDLKKRGILKDKKKLHAWLNDRDNQAFRTRTGRV